MVQPVVLFTVPLTVLFTVLLPDLSCVLLQFFAPSVSVLISQPAPEATAVPAAALASVFEAVPNVLSRSSKKNNPRFSVPVKAVLEHKRSARSPVLRDQRIVIGEVIATPERCNEFKPLSVRFDFLCQFTI